MTSIPKKIAKYDIRGTLGKGSMGVVYDAYDPFVQREVAIKIDTSNKSTNPKKLERFHQLFFQEARAVGSLHHPNIVSVYDAGMENNLAYMVMEKINGQSLADFASEGNLLSLERVIDIVFKCAKALDYAHRKGVVHRDIKPSNIMLGNDEEAVKIMDFGIATVETGDQSQQRTGLVGTPYYMSPEQVREEAVGPQGDVYSLGVVFYQLLIGEPPFRADNLVTLVHDILNVEAPALRASRPELPQELADIVEKCLQKDSKKRFQSGQELASILTRQFDSLRYGDKKIENMERVEQLLKLEFFREFSPQQLNEVSQAATWAKFEKSDTVITEGDLDEAFYIIITGTAVVAKDGKELSSLKRGECFGEVGFLTKHKRTATIRSNSTLILMKLNAERMKEVSDGCQLNFYRAFIRTLIRREQL